MTARITRRRLLAISAAGIAAPGFASGNGTGNSPTLRWQGTALGAGASITLPSHPGAASAIADVVAELDRLEGIFSLFRNGSQIARLNRAGSIARPAPEFVELLQLSRRVHAATGGAFDPTVQPLWSAYAAAGRDSDTLDIPGLRQRCGLDHVEVSPDRIAFAKPGMAITLNGIAQGLAADRVAALLRDRGFNDIVVDAGEIVAAGRDPGGRLWQATIAGADGRTLRHCRLDTRALATSSPLATVFDPGGRVGHILDPRTGRPANAWRTVSVSAPRAALADALSTAFCILDRDRIGNALTQFPGTRIEALAS